MEYEQAQDKLLAQTWRIDGEWAQTNSGDLMETFIVQESLRTLGIRVANTTRIAKESGDDHVVTVAKSALSEKLPGVKLEMNPTPASMGKQAER